MKRYALPSVGIASVVLFIVHIYYAYQLPYYSFIDDITYIGAAFDILNHVRCPLVAGTICNYEHPPLSKLLMALGFEVFGKYSTIGYGAGSTGNQFSGRFFQMLMGSFSPLVLYLLVEKVSGDWKTGLLAAVFLLIDPLYFTLSSTALLDDAMAFFALVAILLYFYSDRLGQVRGPLIAGAVFGLSLLSKETAAFILLALLSYVLVAGTGSIRSRLLSCLWIIIPAVLVFCIGLELYDAAYTSFPSFLSQIYLMLSFHTTAGPSQITYLKSISDCGIYAGLCPTNRSLIPHVFYSMLPFNPVTNGQCTACWAATNPLDWLFYIPPVVFIGNLVLAPNYALVWLLFAWVPYGLWRLKGIFPTPGGKLVTLSLILFGWNLGSNVFLFSVLGRGVFLWYFLPAIPVLSMGASYMLTRPRVPVWVTLAIAATVVAVGIALSPLVLPLLYPSLPQPCTSC